MRSSGFRASRIVTLTSAVLLAFTSGAFATVAQMGAVLAPIFRVELQTAEISAYMPAQKLLFVVGGEKVMEILDLNHPEKPQKLESQNIAGQGSSVSVSGDLLAVSSLADENSDTGFVEIFRVAPGAATSGPATSGAATSGPETALLQKLAEFRPCHQPDMITFTPDGKKLLVACEGSPRKDFSADPPGGIAVITLPATLTTSTANLAQTASVKVLGFEGLDSTALKTAGVRRVGTAPYLKTLEPEYITVSEDSKTAWVSLQENNAIAKVDLVAERIANVFPLGTVDHLQSGFGLDVKSDGKIDIVNVPVRGLRQPDGIAALTAGGKNFIFTANEGAPVNDYKQWTDETSVHMLQEAGKLDPKFFDEKVLAQLQDLTVSRIDECPEVKGGKCPYVTSFGTRSLSIFDGESGKLLWDSGDQLERMFAKVAPEYFNWNAKKKKKVKMDARSADKGCEPENVTLGMVGNKHYAFLGLERMSGVAVFDVTDINSPKLVDYYLDVKDRGPEGLLFVPAAESPIPGQSLLIVGYEYSKSLVIYKVK